VSTQIFINYRRDDAAAEAASIASKLRGWFGEASVFFDTSSIEAGVQWPDAVERALEAARVVLVLIGPDWLRAGANEWGQRRIDSEADWVRRELAYSLSSSNKVLIPTLLRGAKMPPPSVLPTDLARLPSCNALALTPTDIESCSLLRDALSKYVPIAGSGYPKQMKFERASSEAIDRALATDLQSWRCVQATAWGETNRSANYLVRDFEFASFTEAVRFMIAVAPQFEVAYHHPLWENAWRRLTVRLSTWDLNWEISQLDLAQARYLESRFSEIGP
jgi:pterin-4a-carbinolamine dehydratase